MNIAIIGAGYILWSPFRPDTIYEPGRMVAGGETAMIRISQELARQGHTVTVYIPTDKEADYDGVRWLPLCQLQRLDTPPIFDVAVSYDQPSALNLVHAHINVLENQTNNPQMDSTVSIDAYVFKSAWHTDAVRRCTLGIPKERCYVIGNGVDTELYAKRDQVARIPCRIIWTSSPDRGLHHALRIFERVHNQVPQTTFHVYYDFSKAFDPSKWAMDYRTQQLWESRRLMDRLPGVSYIGPVDKRTLAKAEMQAEMLLYPCDTSRPSEGFSIATLQGLAAGCTPLISDCDALGELWGNYTPMLQLPIDYDDWAAAVLSLLADTEARSQFKQQGYERAEQFTWQRMGLEYGALLTRLWQEKPCPACGRPLASCTSQGVRP